LKEAFTGDAREQAFQTERIKATIKRIEGVPEGK
jgi:hypothetical protein